MAEAVVYALIATAFLIIMIVSPLSQEEGEGCFGLNRRLAYNILDRPPIFDPLVTKIERDASDKKGLRDTNSMSHSDNSRLVSEVSETYLYLTAGGKLNTTLRLILLFPLLDKEPKDGLVSFNELEAWITQQALEALDYFTNIEMESKDRDGDSALSLWEYLPRFSEKDLERGEMGIGEAGWWHERFTIADTDQNGRLNFTELRGFLHPGDSNNEELQNWMLKDRIKRIGDENDGKVKFKKFKEHLYERYKDYVEFETAGSRIPDAEEMFAELDVNKDRFLSVEELKPIRHYLYPGEIYYARFYTSFLMNEADDDKDWKLSLEEMLRHEKIFYNTVHVDGPRDNHYDRDEF